MHTMRTKKGHKGFMVVKVDLEKAYDFLRWEFIRDTLLSAGFLTALVDIIKRL